MALFYEMQYLRECVVYKDYDAVEVSDGTPWDWLAVALHVVVQDNLLRWLVRDWGALATICQDCNYAIHVL